MRVGRWPFLALVVLGLLAVLYRVGPCRRSAKWRWVTVGSAFATTVWLLASAGFSIYVSYFANYDKSYGSLGAVIILLLWLYISFYIILLGAEITPSSSCKPRSTQQQAVRNLWEGVVLSSPTMLRAVLKETADPPALSRAIPR